MFPIILNHLDEDDEDLLNEAHYYGNQSGYNETSPLHQDNLRCTVGQRFVTRQFSIASANRNPLINQTIQPGERIIEIKSESDDDEQQQAQTSNSVDERANLIIDDYRFQRFRPIRIHSVEEHDLNSPQIQDHSQARIRRNYQILRSKKRFTFPICFFVTLYISFLLMSSLIFTMFEQKMSDNDSYFDLQKEVMSSLTNEQFDLVEQFIKQSIKVEKTGLDAMSILLENKLLINKLIKNPTATTTTTNQPPEFKQLTSTILIQDTNSIDINELRSRKIYNWDFQQSLFFVVSIATTIGYGNLTPESDYGKVYTIIFGLIAIPYTTILFSIVVSKFSNGPLRRFKLRLLTKHFTEKSHETLRIIRFICLVMSTIFILIMILGVPAAIFKSKEKNWSYLDGFYFIFISITTTGLGDFVPEFFGTLHYWFYEIVVIFFLYFGIVMIMLWMTLIKSVFRRTNSIKLDEYDQNDEEDRHEQILEEQVLINYHYHQKNYVNYHTFQDGPFYGYDQVDIRVPRSTS